MKKKLAIVLSAIMAIGVIGSVSFSPAVSVSAEESNSEFENPVYDEATDTTDYDYAGGSKIQLQTWRTYLFIR